MYWAGMPNSGWTRGLKVRDLVRGGKTPRDCTVSAATNWDTNPGCVYDFSASNASTTNLDFTSGPFTVASYGYIYADIAIDTYHTLFARSEYFSESSNNGWALLYQYDANGYEFNFPVSRNSSSNAANNLWSNTTAAQGWWLIVGTSNGTDLRKIYVNGTLAASRATNINPITSAGNLVTDTSNVHANRQAMAWSRCLSDLEVGRLYDTVRRGNPETLNWVSTRVIFTPVPPPGSISVDDGALLYQSRTLW